MAVFKCKMCGANLIIQPDQLVVECNYCDTVQTVPALDSEKKANLFNRANRLRMSGEFDKAAGVYENIIAEFPKEAEAYWGLCLCNYGIEYVDDPATAKKVPTCHRASFEKLVNDENFKLALENSTYASQQIYMEEAKEIDRIMEDILMTVRNEKPYDVFICYKETDEFGSRTIDSVLAQDVYDALTAKGMKVFFARITLEDKLGKMYEPYIFSALNSAKVMLAIGTTADRFEAVWVRNEWSRFLKLMSKDKSKVLIPCYKDIDAYDLPEEFKMLQAQDMSKIGFMQDLVRGVEKIVVVSDSVAPQIDTENNTNNNKQLMLKGNTLYTGEVFADVPHGFGRAEYENGNIYEGEWNRGKRTGNGKYIWKKGGEWVGEFRDNNFWNGKGTYYFENGDCHEGEVKDGKFNGQGKRVWAQGGEWTGEFKDNDLWNGNGRDYNYKAGYFDGELKNGKLVKGTYVWHRGGEWTGEFKDGKCWNGNGISYNYNDGYYEGELREGKRIKGKYTWNKGGEWIGEFNDDKFWTGEGTCYYGDGYYYIGEMKEGERDGQGVYYYKEGTSWSGEFKKGRCWNGYGVKYDYEDGAAGIRWNTTDYFEGEFKEGKLWKGTHVKHSFSDGKPIEYNIVDGKQKACFVATCVYGSYDCPEVWTLRRYRDRFLDSTWFGRAFIFIYYAISPTIVKWFGSTDWFKRLWKNVLDKKVYKLNNIGVEDTPYNDKDYK